MPYPGLEGGRRGHWGGSNEKLSSAIKDRTEEPKYSRLLNRGPSANQYVVSSHKEAQSVCLFEASNPHLSKVIIDAIITTPVHAFSHKVDRFGMNLTVKGKELFNNQGAEWHNEQGEKLKVTNAGYYLHQAKTIFIRNAQGAALLYNPTVEIVNDTPIFRRTFELLSSTPILKFKLPTPFPPQQKPSFTVETLRDGFRLHLKGAHSSVYHYLQTNSDLALEFEYNQGNLWVKLPKQQKGNLFRHSSWVTKKPQNSSWVPHSDLQHLSPLTTGGPRHNAKDSIVKGKLNADPNASGSGYALDEIPIPFSNAYGMPMTTSGLTFDSFGNAYLSTLVGDIWKVTGIDDKLEQVRWQRFATGLNVPLGLETVDGLLHVLTQHQILKLHDQNKDGEADKVEPFSTLRLPPGINKTYNEMQQVISILAV